MTIITLGDCPDCVEGVCTMNCTSAVIVTGAEWVAASIWAGIFPSKATAAQVADFLAAKEPTQ